MKRKRSEHRLAVALAARRPAITTIDEDAVRRHLQANATCFEPNRDTSPGMRVLTTAPLTSPGMRVLTTAPMTSPDMRVLTTAPLDLA